MKRYKYMNPEGNGEGLWGPSYDYNFACSTEEIERIYRETEAELSK